MAQMDMELKKAFTEVQKNRLETSWKMNMLENQHDMVKTSKHKYILTEKGTSDLPDDARVYLSVGRMFVLTSVDDMRADLKGKQEKCNKAIELLQKKKEFLAQSLKDQENNLRELVQQKKQSTSKPAAPSE